MSPNSDAHDLDQNSGAGGNLKTIDLEFETLRQFREVMASRLNYEGFFVVTNDPLPKGTPLQFRFLLPDGFVLVEGTADVVFRGPVTRRTDLTTHQGWRCYSMSSGVRVAKSLTN